MPKRHKVIETTDIMLQMVACERGVAALPAWLVAEYQGPLGVVPVRLGKRGIAKKSFLGLRATDTKIDFIADFVRLAATKRPRTVKTKKRAH